MARHRQSDRFDRDHRAVVDFRLAGDGRSAVSDTPKHIRTPFSRVRGLGAAHSGTEHFWRQRLTAVANIPLTIAVIVIFIMLLGSNQAAVARILGSPVVAVIMLLFVVSITTHMRIGM